MTQADGKSPGSVGVGETGVTRMDALRYLSDLRSHFQIYHNHKETSAWAAAALYLVILGQLYVSVKTDALPDLWTRAALTIVIVTLGAAVFVHLQAQMSMRREAADCVAACLYLSAKIMGCSASEVSTALFRLEVSKDRRSPLRHVLPKVISKRAQRFGRVGLRTKQRLEWSVYVAVIVFALVALARVWF